MSKRKAATTSTMDSWVTRKKEKVDEVRPVTEKIEGTWKSVESDLLIYNPVSIEGRSKIAGFDVDGTVIVTKSGKTFPVDENDWKFFSPRVTTKLHDLHKNGFKIVFFTNQKGIKIGKQCPHEFKRKVEEISSQIGLPIQVFVSLGSLKFRKPYIGMWKILEDEENGGVKVDRSASFYVGDAAGRQRSDSRKTKDHSSADRFFAMNVGTKFYTPEEFFLDQTTNEILAPPSFDPSVVLDGTTDLFSPSDTPIPGVKQELVVLVGFPGCGKSTLAATLKEKYAYNIVNRDSLKTWKKCVDNAKIYLQRGENVIVDNTNGDVESRKRYCELAQKMNVDCRCFVFSCDINQAHHNIRYRTIAATDPNHEEVGLMVLRMFKSKYQEPQLSEGFSSIVKVNFKANFKSSEDESIYRMFLCES
ncbi:hypothetical protein AB6A40_000775 [Gnathostoma spinigerum]|uniref:Bifunctional polynucleotide phosphatase/kinase n=1 Tax=Gnathostoma spinigerum TaxID=75299 RepID=A0ABD6E9K0_9BILA